MLKICDLKDCSGCTACKNICPRNAISMKENEKGFRYPHVNSESCINCKLCEKVCPVLNSKENEKKSIIPKAYAAYNNDVEIRMKSSSGGIFSLIAEEILKRNGIVFGAVLDENLNVVHKKAANIVELEQLRGSKYLQSDLGNTYREIRDLLNDGTQVLFTGTPCQIAGLKSFLGKEYENLYMQDFICHGVPSKKLWEKYLSYREKNGNSKIKKVFFRNKDNKGWSEYQVLLEFENKKSFFDVTKDLYMQTFLKDIALRDSCYNCKSKKINRDSDITVADFWGISKIAPEMNDEKGVSLVIINSKKGEEILNNIKSNITLKEVEFFEAISGNKSIIQSAMYPEKRDEFFQDLETLELDDLLKKYNITI